MAPATEIAILPLKAGTNLEDATSSAGTIWQELMNTVLGQDGCQCARFGVEVENPTQPHLFTDWDSVDLHKKFIADR